MNVYTNLTREWERGITVIFAIVLLLTVQTIGKITSRALTIKDSGSYTMILSKVSTLELIKKGTVDWVFIVRTVP